MGVGGIGGGGQVVGRAVGREEDKPPYRHFEVAMAT